MTNYAFSPPPVVTVPVIDGRLFPVRRIFCIGKNYQSHIKEMGGALKKATNNTEKGDPTIFCKPADAVCTNAKVPYPLGTNDLHHEVELVVALRGGGSNLDPKEVREKVFGYAVGCDLTRRDLQAVAKSVAGPWDIAKALDDGAVIGPLTPLEQCGYLTGGRLALQVEGVVRQSSDISEMLWPVDEGIAAISRYFELSAGDLIYTGTPEGVAALAIGEQVQLTMEGLAPHSFQLA